MVVPTDWKEVRLGDIAQVKTGSRNNQDKVADGRYPFYVRSAHVESIDSFSYDTEAILIPGEGGIGEIFHYINGRHEVHQRVYRVSNFTPDFCPKFIYFYLRSFFGAHAMRNTVKATVDSLRLPTFLEFELLCPPLRVQEAIAEALSDADAAIESLDALIAKKRDVKQATMQQLLTGRTRLPGFTAEWREVSIGSFTDCKAGGTPSTSVPAYWGGNIRWMSSGELNLKRVREVSGRITQFGLENSSAQLFPANSVLIGLAGQGKTRGTAAINLVSLTTNQSIAAIFPSGRHDSKFLFYVMETKYKELRDLSDGGGGRGGLNLAIIKDVRVNVPELDEQKKISEVLWSMDDEIEALTAQVLKLRMVKEGMMQDLLTGKVRLV